jgi:hypothetical protein
VIDLINQDSNRAWTAAIPIPSQVFLKKHQMVNKLCKERRATLAMALHTILSIESARVTSVFLLFPMPTVGKLHVRTHLNPWNTRTTSPVLILDHFLELILL